MAAPTPRKLQPCPEEDAFLDLLRTADLLSRPFASLMKAADLSSAQYNVLRILRGAAPAGLPCGEIAARMVTRDPDITRLLDRLEKRALIERTRDSEDRRVVHARIAPAGLELLARLDQPVRDAHRRTLGHLGADGLADLRARLAACRRDAPPAF